MNITFISEHLHINVFQKAKKKSKLNYYTRPFWKILQWYKEKIRCNQGNYRKKTKHIPSKDNISNRMVQKKEQIASIFVDVGQKLASNNSWITNKI